MPLTIHEVKERLATIDELTLIDLLGVTSEQIVDAFEYHIENRLSHFTRVANDYYEGDEEDDYE